MDENQDLFGLTFQTTHRALSGVITNKDWLESWKGHVESLGQARAQYHQALQQVLSSNEFTETGKAKRKAELQRVLQDRLKADEADHLAGYDRHLDQLKRSAKRRETPSELGQVLDYLKGQELRQEIRTLDPIELRGLYESRIHDESGRWDTWLQAVEDDPGGGLLPGEIFDQGKANRLLRTMNPDTRQKIADLQELRNAHQHFLQLVARELPAPDPIADMAKGRSESDS